MVAFTRAICRPGPGLFRWKCCHLHLTLHQNHPVFSMEQQDMPIEVGGYGSCHPSMCTFEEGWEVAEVLDRYIKRQCDLRDPGAEDGVQMDFLFVIVLM
ncbi:uncharacterized protein LOC113348878 isoform X2 [Papaver somniferum]|uniref:uncharacterized protein LOC113348878 isoform X2 n=1 Tax=Papaver somniferum TaxID=3469 RepID=UPI000E705C55|nr:uncharacterized protein LOC113348878 isoform X2 [Papaver somniferum]